MDTTTGPLTQLDQIVVDPKSKNWLKEHGLLPSRWGLAQAEAPRILAGKFRLDVTFSPFTILDFSAYPIDATPFIICFSSKLLEPGPLSREEVIAMCLHEIGHKLNAFKSRNSVGSPEFVIERKDRTRRDADEDDADDYVRHCGFGQDLASGLVNLRDAGESFFNTPKVQTVSTG